jgi:hypothetical protein
MRPGLPLLLAVLALPWVGLAQDRSVSSLRGTRALRLPAGYRLEVIGTGFRLPQDLAVESATAVWLLSQADGPGGAGSLVRVPLGEPAPVDAGSLASISIPFAPGPARFRVGSLARHPATGHLFVAEQSGRHLFRVSPAGEVVLYARGLERLAETRAVAFDPAGRLVVLDFTGAPLVADAGAASLRELFGGGESGPVLYRLRVEDEALALPRNVEAQVPFFAPGRGRWPRWDGVFALPTGDLVLSGSGGRIDRLRPDGTVVPAAGRSAARVVAAGTRGELYGVDTLGGRIVRILSDGAVEELVQGLVRPTALAVLPDGSLIVAGDTGRLLRLRPGGE